MNIKRIATAGVTSAIFLGLSIFPALAKVETVPGPWDVGGTYDINVEYLGVDYPETLILTQSGTDITGVSLDTIPPGSYFEVYDGSVTGNDIDIYARKGSLVVHMEGVIAPDGSMSGTWEDEAPGTRDGTWRTTDGNATRFEGNHGQYVRMSDNKKEAAQSRAGMPVQSKGHVE